MCFQQIIFLSFRQVSEYLSATGQLDKLAGMALKRIEHFYYKTAVVYGAMRKLAALQQEEAAAAAAGETVSFVVKGAMGRVGMGDVCLCGCRWVGGRVYAMGFGGCGSEEHFYY